MRSIGLMYAALDPDVESPHPFRHAGVVGRVAPFATTAVLAYTAAFIPPGPRSWTELVASVAILLALILAALTVPWEHLPRWVSIGLPIGVLLPVALARDTLGVTTSGFEAVIMLPVFWVALHGSRREMVAMLGATAVMLAAPMLIDAHAYPVGEWRRAVLWMGMAIVIGFTVQRLVASYRGAARAMRQRAEELAHSEARYDMAFESSALALAWIAEDGRFLRVNRALGEMLGYSEADLLARTLSDLRGPVELAVAVEGTGASLGGHGDAQNIEQQLIRADGGRVWAVLTLTTVRESPSDPQVVYLQVQDVTARRELEDELRSARTIAEAANRAKDQFLSRMSHELRTPLSAILGFAELMELDAVSADQHGSLEAISSAGYHLLDLINEILDISRIEQGQFALSPVSMTVVELLDEALELLRATAEAAGVHLPVVLPAMPVYVFADRQRVRQIFINLLSNAIKFNHRGGSVDVVVGEGSLSVPSVRITVRDTGSGLTADQMQRLFRPFERLNASALRIEGTGLGLALSQRLAAEMGGEIDVDSEVGVGTTFWVDLPAAAAPPSPAAGAPGVEPATVRYGSNRTLVYVEDVRDTARLIQRILGLRPDVRVHHFDEGRPALAYARANPPDLVLLDMHLPDMDGDSVLAGLRDHRATRSVPVVMFSADATAQQIDRMRAAGADDYITKPVTASRLLAVVDSYLEAEAVPAAAASAAHRGHRDGV